MNASRGFTLIELLVALALVSAALAITFGAFFSVSRAWQRGSALADDLNHGDFVMEQLVVGLRSAFYPGTQTNAAGGDYGFTLEDHGDGAEARDVIGWVKTGSALLGLDSPLYQGLHRVRVSLEPDEDDQLTIATRAWRPYAKPDSFDAEQLDPFHLSGKVRGLNCRVATNRTDEGWEWDDDWSNEATNHLPLAVEVSLYLDPLEPTEAPVEMKRLIEIPVAPMSWQASGGGGAPAAAATNTASTNAAAGASL